MAKHSKNVISLESYGSTKHIMGFLRRMKDRKDLLRIFNEYGAKGVELLSMETPVDTGKTAASWGYEIRETLRGWEIYWLNSNEANGIPIVVLIKYGHGTRGGAYVAPNNFIDPIVDRMFREMANNIWDEVTSS